MSVVNGLKWVCIVLLLTGCAMALSACGGGDDSDSDDTVVVVTNVVGGTTVVVTNVVAAQSLVAPQLVTPADGTGYSSFLILAPGFNVNFEWTAVPGAVSYVLEVDGAQHAVAGTTQTLPIPEFGNHKWRVWAKDSNGASGPASGKFSFDLILRLLTPI